MKWAWLRPATSRGWTRRKVTTFRAFGDSARARRYAPGLTAFSFAGRARPDPGNGTSEVQAYSQGKTEMLETRSRKELFVRGEQQKQHVELEAAMEQNSTTSSIFRALRSTSAYSQGIMGAVVGAILSESFALPSRAGVLADVLQLIISERPEVRGLLPSEGSCAGHRILLEALSGKKPQPANPAVSALLRDNVQALASEIFATAPANFDAETAVAIANGDVLPSSPSAGSDSRGVSLLELAARLGAHSCARFLLANDARVSQREADSAIIGGNLGIIRELLDRFPDACDASLLANSNPRHIYNIQDSDPRHIYGLQNSKIATHL
jgi:hypothetical protein